MRLAVIPKLFSKSEEGKRETQRLLDHNGEGSDSEGLNAAVQVQ